MEIITGVERRRRWRLEEKLRIVAETEQPGASFVAVARRYEVSRGLLWNWRQQVRRGDLVPEPMPVFTPVQITADLTGPRPLRLAHDGGRGGGAECGADELPARGDRLAPPAADLASTIGWIAAMGC